MVNFMFNYKRQEIIDIEKSYDIHVIFSIDENKFNNEFDITKRDSLTNEEKEDLCPIQHIGKVNELFDDCDLYNNELNVSFADNCYYEKANNQNKNNNRRYSNNRKNNVVSRKKKGFFDKIKRIFK